MSRRGGIALAIVVLWIAGLGLLARRELLKPDVDRLAEAGLRVSPGATFYGVSRDGRHIGYASSTIDTLPQTIRVVEYLVADLPVGGRSHRASARTIVTLSRGLRLRDFRFELDAEQGPVVATGRMEGDTLLRVSFRAGADAPADTQSFRVTGPVLLPTLVPLAIALGAEPVVGRSYDVPVFDPVGMAPKQLAVRIDAESLFVVHDSAVFDPGTQRWQAALPDTVRAWHVASGDISQFTGWVDAQGRVVQATQLGTLELRRMPYEVAFENWQIAKRARDGTAPIDPDEDILEATAIAADVRVTDLAERLVVRLRGVDLTGYDLASPRQTLRGDTLTIVREPLTSIRPDFRLGSFTARMLSKERERWRPFLRAEPLIETVDPDIQDLARRLRAPTNRDPRETAMRINRWVHDSLEKRTTFGVPSARAVLAARSGDCNEHTQLYVALARAAGLPARVAAGLVHIGGKFYYHAWPEVYLGSWVAVDPTLGQFPADAAHLRFVVGGLERQAELLRLIGNLEIDVLNAR